MFFGWAPSMAALASFEGLRRNGMCSIQWDSSAQKCSAKAPDGRAHGFGVCADVFAGGKI